MHAKKARKKHGFSTKPCLCGSFFGLKCALYPIFRIVIVAVLLVPRVAPVIPLKLMRNVSPDSFLLSLISDTTIFLIEESPALQLRVPFLLL